MLSMTHDDVPAVKETTIGALIDSDVDAQEGIPSGKNKAAVV
jgi:hypothetical protein